MPLQASPPDSKRPSKSNIDKPASVHGDDPAVKSTSFALPDINSARQEKMLKELTNMERMKGMPWENKPHFMPLTAKELVKYGHIPPLPAYVLIPFYHGVVRPHATTASVRTANCTSYIALRYSRLDTDLPNLNS